MRCFTLYEGKDDADWVKHCLMMKDDGRSAGLTEKHLMVSYQENMMS